MRAAAPRRGGGRTLFEGGKATTRATTGASSWEIDHGHYDIGAGAPAVAIRLEMSPPALGTPVGAPPVKAVAHVAPSAGGRGR